ncbi:MAG: menaquinone biosynthesis decarboxylase [Planctomycetota bacterium]|nr:menaquinone biosynthesis decarboxylase [Planctomycetota bacterium]
MAFDDLRGFIRALEARGQLLRVREEVSAELEIAEFADRMVKRGGPALLFEKVAGSEFPVAINLFGSRDRMALALGVEDLDGLAAEVESLLRIRPGGTLLEKLRMLPTLAKIASFPPVEVSGGSCREVILEGEAADLTALPALRCWPKDAGRFITAPCVFTRSPEGEPNCGVYRMQVLGRDTTAMHWHVHHDGARHFEAWRAAGRPMPVAVAVGVAPEIFYAATAPVPPGIDEMLLAGFLRKKPVEMVRCLTSDLRVPASAEFVIEGFVAPDETCVEGPFGDHTGFYSPPGRYPVFRVKAITRRRGAIWQAMVVGRPPMEDTFLGKATERMFLPMARLVLPEITDMCFPGFGVFHNCVFVSIKKRYPYHARKTMHGIWGMGQLSLCKMIVVVDDSVDVHDTDDVLFHLAANVDPARDIEVVRGPCDVLDHACGYSCAGAKIGFDATRKWKEEGYPAEWPEETRMPEDVRKAVSEKLRAMGLDRFV